MEFLFHLTGIYPDWYPKENRITGKVKGRIGAQDFTKGVGEVILAFFEEWLDPSLVQKKYRNPLGIAIKWELKNGNVFDILTYEQATEQWEGWKGDVVWFDEPPPRDKYVATLRGLVDKGGRVWLTLTPLRQAWIYDDIYTKSDKQKIYVQTVDIRDNPTLSEKDIEQFESSLTEEEKEARLHGRFMHLSGLVYKEFGEHNICEPPRINKRDFTLYFSLDLHERLPAACIWVAVDKNDNHWIYDELWLEDADIEQLAHAIHAQEGELTPHIRFIDPAMDKENQLMWAFNPRKELMKHGIFCQRANTDPHLGKSHIRKALRPQYSTILKSEIPQLRISRWCQKTVYEFQHYVWGEFAHGRDEKERKDRPKKMNDHFMDNLRYIYNYGPRYMPSAPTDDDEIKYEGAYAKYPTKQTVSTRSSYHSLIEGRDNE